MSKLYEELQALVGSEGPPTVGIDAVCPQMIRHYCEAIEDANPLYTDEEYAKKSKYRSIIAPPGMVAAFTLPPLWPNGQEARWRKAETLPNGEPVDPFESAMQKMEKAGYTGIFATGMIQEFLRPLFPGDRVARTTRFLSITSEKKTIMGNGYFFKPLWSYINQKDELVSTITGTIFRFKPQE